MTRILLSLQKMSAGLLTLVLVWANLSSVTMGSKNRELSTTYNPFGSRKDLTYVRYPGQPVIFEPMPTITVSRSSYTITSFLRLHKDIQEFEMFADFLKKFYYDVPNPRHLVAIRTAQ